MGAMTLEEFLRERIAEDEDVARQLLGDLAAQVAEGGYTADERGPFTPSRMLSSQLWALYDGQSQRRSFARGQSTAALADPARVLTECEAKLRILDLHESWPVLVETMPEVHFNVETFAARATQQLAWFTMQEYRKRFGDESPTSAILRAMALPYAEHEDYREEWRS